MGGVDPLTAAAIAAIASTGVATVQSSSQSRSQASAMEAQAQREEERIRKQQTVQERQRREELKQALARQRARFGASGINSRGGSAAARISGLAAQVDRDIADQRELNQLSIDNLRANTQTQTRNLMRSAASSSIGKALNEGISFGEKYAKATYTG